MVVSRVEGRAGVVAAVLWGRMWPRGLAAQTFAQTIARTLRRLDGTRKGVHPRVFTGLVDFVAKSSDVSLLSSDKQG
jgi:hypothetical protein